MEVYLLIGITISLLLFSMWKTNMRKNFFINLVGNECGENVLIHGTIVIRAKKNYGNNVVELTTLERKQHEK